MVEGGVGYGERTAAEDCSCRGYLERKGCRNGIRNLRRNCACNGVVESEDRIFNCLNFSIRIVGSGCNLRSERKEMVR